MSSADALLFHPHQYLLRLGSAELTDFVEKNSDPHAAHFLLLRRPDELSDNLKRKLIETILRFGNHVNTSILLRRPKIIPDDFVKKLMEANQRPWDGSKEDLTAINTILPLWILITERERGFFNISVPDLYEERTPLCFFGRTPPFEEIPIFVNRGWQLIDVIEKKILGAISFDYVLLGCKTRHSRFGQAWEEKVLLFPESTLTINKSYAYRVNPRVRNVKEALGTLYGVTGKEAREFSFTERK